MGKRSESEGLLVYSINLKTKKGGLMTSLFSLSFGELGSPAGASQAIFLTLFDP
jgi:hypothetical protein